MDHFTYRNGSLDDKEQIKKLGLTSYAQFAGTLAPEYSSVMNTNLNDDEKVTDLITKSTSFLCLDGNEIIGMAFFISHGNPWDIFKSEWSYIRMVAVNPIYQGKGIAKKLTKMCIDHAKETNEKTITLHTSEEMHAARHLYESLGFKILHEIEPRFGKKYWLYTLDIS